MNTSSLIQDKIDQGKMKFGVCDSKDCDSKQYLFRVKNDFVCDKCLDKIGEILKKLEMLR